MGFLKNITIQNIEVLENENMKFSDIEKNYKSPFTKEAHGDFIDPHAIGIIAYSFYDINNHNPLGRELSKFFTKMLIKNKIMPIGKRTIRGKNYDVTLWPATAKVFLENNFQFPIKDEKAILNRNNKDASTIIEESLSF